MKKLIRAEFDAYLKEQGFLRKAEGQYLKICRNIICNITFELGSIGFTCAVAMQPLYVMDYMPIIHISFGNRLSRFNVIQREWWSYDEPEKGIADIKSLLERNGIPWFNKYCSPEGIVNFITGGKAKEYGIFWFDTYNEQKYLGFSLLYIGQTDEGIHALRVMLNEIHECAVGWMNEYKEQVEELIERINMHPEDIKRIIDDIIHNNKSSFNLE